MKRQELLERILEGLSEEPLRCTGCAACNTVCPLAEWMRPPVSHLMRALAEVRINGALTAPSIWICVECGACTRACPVGLHPHLVMRALREASYLLGFHEEAGTSSEDVVPVLEKELEECRSRAHPSLEALAASAVSGGAPGTILGRILLASRPPRSKGAGRDPAAQPVFDPARAGFLAKKANRKRMKRFALPATKAEGGEGDGR